MLFLCGLFAIDKQFITQTHVIEILRECFDETSHELYPTYIHNKIMLGEFIYSH